MDIQYITDKKGKKNAVLLPLSEWENIQKELKELEKLRDKKQYILELKEAIDEVSLAKEGKIKLQSAKDFLNEL
jgi:PHD/YefM family antitoxin component YafN of YafNO toxin-antitoxin module